MSSELRWERIRDLFHDTLNLPAEARAQFLSSLSAGEAGLGREISSLLDAHVRSGPLRPLDEEEASPTWGQVGPYRLIELLGMGGMGVVYGAERVNADFTQRVALKVLPTGYVDPRLEAQLGRERRILAQLDHPGIARFIDGGTTDDGQPYIAMEYVEGTTLVEYANVCGLTVKARLRLVLAICDALEFAHQHLVVHGDLKPGNILVRADGRPKLLDFGLAGLLEEGRALRSAGTEGWLTPAYASPELIRGQQLTASTDIYAVGIVLYELLAGRRPYQTEGLPPEQLEQVICEQLPEPPSSHVSGRVRRQLAGDVDAIVLKALAKEPSDRYGSVSGLAEDLNRHLDRRPVRARASTRAYRLSKFVSRHRGVVTASGFIAAVLATGIAFSARQAVVAREQRDAAAQARSQAEEVTTFLIDVLQASDPHKGTAHIDETAMALLRLEVERAERVSGQPVVQARLLDVLGQVLLSVGQHEQGRGLLERALALRLQLHGERSADVAESLKHLGRAVSAEGDYQRADSLYRRALAIEQAMFEANDPRIANTLAELGNLMPSLGRFEESEVLHRAALELRLHSLDSNHPQVATSRMSVAAALAQLGDDGAAESLMREVLETRRRVLGAGHAQVASTLIALAGVVSRRRAESPEAERLVQEGLELQALALGENHLELTEGMIIHANILARRGRHTEAEPLLRRVVARRERILGPDHAEVAEATEELGAELQRQGRFVEAERLRREALKKWKLAVGPDHPAVGKSLNGLASLMEARGDYATAEALTREALELFARTQGPRHPSVAQTEGQLASLLAGRGAFAEAEQLLLEAREILASQLRPTHTEVRGIHHRMAEVYRSWGRPAEADHFELLAAGSTFAFPIFSKWFSEFSKLHPDVQIDYQSIGSGGGVQRALEKTVDFGTSDGPLTDEEQRQAPDLLNLPVALGAVAIVYNLSGFPNLKLTPETLAGIYLGRIKQWDHPALARANPGVALPSIAITVVHRSDPSGTTAILADYLAKVSPEWKREVGAGKSVKWPAGLGVQGNEGVSGLVKGQPGSVGYVELAYADRFTLSTAQLRNRAGAFVTPSVESTTAAAAGLSLPEDMRMSITDAAGKAAWPISGFTYVLVRRDLADRARGAAMVRFLQWSLVDGQRLSAPLAYAPLPLAVVESVRAKVGTITFQGATMGAK